MNKESSEISFKMDRARNLFLKGRSVGFSTIRTYKKMTALDMLHFLTPFIEKSGYKWIITDRNIKIFKEKR